VLILPRTITRFIADDKVVYMSVKLNEIMKLSQEDTKRYSA